jgi:hypothetical protein
MFAGTAILVGIEGRQSAGAHGTPEPTPRTQADKQLLETEATV